MKGGGLCIDEHSSSSDLISKLPETIIEIILYLLPTKVAARTSILSREWRYKWTKIPKLELCTSYVSKQTIEEKQVQGKNMERKCKPFNDLLQILLLHQDPIYEFTLDIDTTDENTFGFDQILLHLSKNHPVEILELYGMDGYSWHDLPQSVFSMHHLTDLHLSCFHIYYEPVFNGFCSLRSLSLIDLAISIKTLLHLLSNCPSLESLHLILGSSYLGRRYCTIIQLFECLPKIEYLSTSDDVFEWLVLDSVPQELPALLSQLKYFCFKKMKCDNGHGLAFLPVLIKCSPNLKKIKLKVILWDYNCFGKHSVVWKKYSDVWLKHLNELEVECFHFSNESKTKKEFVKFVKFFLVRSPKLKKVSIFTIHEKNQGTELLETLKRAPRKSPEAIITVDSRKDLITQLSSD